MSTPLHLFGEPEQRADESQWWTPAWLARAAAKWVPRGARVLEPSCGSGNLIEGLLRAGHLAVSLDAVERSRAWADFARDRFGGRVRVECEDFLSKAFEPNSFECVFMNPPFEDDLHARFIAHALLLAPVVVGIFPASVEFGQERDRSLWSRVAQVVRRARCPARVEYGRGAAGTFDTVVLQIHRRTAPRKAGELSHVAEEVFAP